MSTGGRPCEAGVQQGEGEREGVVHSRVPVCGGAVVIR